jgi:predicted PurR-regulated permease PerM
VNIPAVLYVFFAVGTLPAIGLAAWAILAVGLVDNLIGPKLIERGVKIHPLLILFAVLGGIQLMGPIGFIVGPVVIALLLSLIELYPVILLDKSKEVEIADDQSS